MYGEKGMRQLFAAAALLVLLGSADGSPSETVEYWKQQAMDARDSLAKARGEIEVAKVAKSFLGEAHDDKKAQQQSLEKCLVDAVPKCLGTTPPPSKAAAVGEAAAVGGKKGEPDPETKHMEQCTKAGATKSDCEQVYRLAKSGKEYSQGRVVKYGVPFAHSNTQCWPLYNSITPSGSKCYRSNGYQYIRDKAGDVVWFVYGKAICSQDKKRWATSKQLGKCYSASYSARGVKGCVVYGKCRDCRKVKATEVACSKVKHLRGFGMM